MSWVPCKGPVALGPVHDAQRVRLLIINARSVDQLCRYWLFGKPRSNALEFWCYLGYSEVLVFERQQNGQ